MNLLKLCVAAVSLLLISCGSFGEGMLAAFVGYNPYGLVHITTILREAI